MTTSSRTANSSMPDRRETWSRAIGSLRAWYFERRGRGALEVTVLFLLLQVALVTWSLTDRAFPYLSVPDVSVVTQAIPWLALLAIGEGIVIMCGAVDITVAMNMGMAELVWLTMVQNGDSLILASIVAIVVGIGIGVFNAMLVNVFRLPSLIATLGMYGVLWGAQLAYTGQEGQAPRVSGQLSESVINVVTGNIAYGVHAQMIYLVIITIVMWYLMHRHWVGNHIAAVGGNESAARAVGINPDRTRYIAFGLLGLLAGMAAILQSVQQLTLIPGTTRGVELDAIAGTIIGGTALRGGKGSVLGMVLGVALLKSFQSIVLLYPAFPAFYLQTFVGAMIIVFAVVNQYFDSKAK